MIKSATRSANRKTFTLSTNGERHTYNNDKEGKRQAILDSLDAIETVTVGQDVYLPSNEALQVVAAVLYPDGIQSEDTYQIVCQVTEKACAHIGYGHEVELGPPGVPFSRRGSYRKRYPPVDVQLVLNELKLAGISSYHPQQEVASGIIWNQAGLSVYGKPWHQLTAEQQLQIQEQVNAITEESGWRIEVTGQDATYIKPLAVDVEGVKRHLVRYLNDYDGRPIPARTVITQAQLGAYGRAFYSNELVTELATAVMEVLESIGYYTEPTEGEYRPVAVEILLEIESQIVKALSTLNTVPTDFGPALLLRAILNVVKTIANVETISEWQAQQLLQTGPIAQTLRQLGFKTEPAWCQAYHFKPSLGDDRTHQVILKEVRVQRDPNKTLSLAQGLGVYTPAIAIDDIDDTLIYLEMIGAKQSVKANWAALVGGGKVHWIGRKRVRLDGMNAHIKIQSTLPCGWANHILIHKQVSLKEMNPEQPFYLLDDGSQPIPPLFYAMLNKALALPLLESWSAYLWWNGRERKLISLLNDGEGQGYAIWRVLPTPDEWQRLIQKGLRERRLKF